MDERRPARMSDEQVRRRRSRSLALALALAAFVVLVYVVTVYKLGANVLHRPL